MLPEEREPSEESEGESMTKDFKTIDKDKWTEILDNLDPDDFKYKM